MGITKSGLICDWCGKYILPVLHTYRRFKTNTNKVYFFHVKCGTEFEKVCTCVPGAKCSTEKECDIGK